MDGCATFVMDVSGTCHRIFSRCIIHVLFTEPLKLLKVSRDKVHAQ